MDKEELKKIIVNGIEYFSDKVSDKFDNYENGDIEFDDYEKQYDKLLNKTADNILAKISDEKVMEATPGSCGIQKLVIGIEAFDIYEFWIGKEKFILGKTDLENLILKAKIPDEEVINIEGIESWHNSKYIDITFRNDFADSVTHRVPNRFLGKSIQLVIREIKG